MTRRPSLLWRFTVFVIISVASLLLYIAATSYYRSPHLRLSSFLKRDETTVALQPTHVYFSGSEFVGFELTTQQNEAAHYGAESLPIPLLSSKSYISQDELRSTQPQPHPPRLFQPPKNPNHCHMENCFDFSKCQQGLKVYVYPQRKIVNAVYGRMLDVIQSSKYYTNDPKQACVFISGVDTMDQDIGHGKKVLRNLKYLLHELPYWNNGVNHLIINLYAGTFPNYVDRLGVDIGYAMLTKASSTTRYTRYGFDLAFPLFHDNLDVHYNVNQDKPLPLVTVHKYLLVFKGQRYVNEQTSKSRNRLSKIDNGNDIILVTKCVRGNEKTCSYESKRYGQFDFYDMLKNSTFCLVPRGRRIGSYRLLEVMRFGCIPVLLGDDYELPFSEVINWKSVALYGDEDLLTQVPQMIRNVSQSKMMHLKSQTKGIWSQYFSSLSTIVLTTLQILEMRLNPQLSVSSAVWNSHPGSWAVSPLFSNDQTAYPFYTQPGPNTRYTTLFYVREKSKNLLSSLQSLTACRHVHSVFVFVIGESQVDLHSHVVSVSQSISTVPIHVHTVESPEESFHLYEEFPTDALLFLHQRDTIISEELDLTFSVWKEYPERIVGHLARTHVYNDDKKTYQYSYDISTQYSMVLLDTALIHRGLETLRARKLSIWCSTSDGSQALVRLRNSFNQSGNSPEIYFTYIALQVPGNNLHCLRK